MTDACGCGDDEPRNDDGELEEREPERFWEVSELRFAAAAGLFLLAGFVADLNDASGSVVTGLNAVALALGALLAPSIAPHNPFGPINTAAAQMKSSESPWLVAYSISVSTPQRFG